MLKQIVKEQSPYWNLFCLLAQQEVVMQQDRKGFSFIELLIVVVVVVTVIREIVIPNFF